MQLRNYINFHIIMIVVVFVLSVLMHSNIFYRKVYIKENSIHKKCIFQYRVIYFHISFQIIHLKRDLDCFIRFGYILIHCLTSALLGFLHALCLSNMEKARLNKCIYTYIRTRIGQLRSYVVFVLICLYSILLRLYYLYFLTHVLPVLQSLCITSMNVNNERNQKKNLFYNYLTLASLVPSR